MTSNLATSEITEYAGDAPRQQHAVETVLARTLPHEFLNRLDSTIIFQQLTQSEISAIVALELVKVATRLHEKHIQIETTKELAAYIATAGYDPVFGARPLKRVIQDKVLDPLSMEIIEGRITEGAVICIDEKQGKISFLNTSQKVHKKKK